MIYFNLTIKNIFSKSKNTIFPKNWFHKIPFDRTIEIDYGKINDDIFTAMLSTKFSGSDHAGPKVEASILGHGFTFSLPKNRHWNYRKDCWLEDYDQWMKEAISLSKMKDNSQEYFPYMFSEYYENGLTPEEGVNELFSAEYEDYTEEEYELFNKLNNPVCDGYSFEEYVNECKKIISEEYSIEVSFNDEFTNLIMDHYKDDIPVKAVAELVYEQYKKMLQDIQLLKN